jgi:aspartyl-tRNA(Asn)/glutamyl-tRNA(Gln) amidotransferase subunit A
MSVVDAALMMNVMALPDARDWTSLPYESIDYLSNLQDGVKGLRIAYSPTLGHAQVDAEVAAAVRLAVESLADIGAHVEECDLGFEDPRDIITGLWFAGAWQIWSTLSEQQQALTDPDFRAQAELGSRLSVIDIHQLNQRRGQLGSHMRQFMQHYDLIVTPTVAVPAFDALPAGQEIMNAETMLGWTPFSYPFNLTQQPAITVPCGLTKDGLPIGLQLVGPMFGDALVLRAARAFEERHPVLRPKLSTIE